MKFHILYIEDKERDQVAYSEGITQYNILLEDDSMVPGGAVKKYIENSLHVTICPHPDKLLGFLENNNFDLIIADLMFMDTALGAERNYLGNIIEIVNNIDSSLPIIALSDRVKFNQCLKYEDRLFDILDKNSSSKDYIGFRIFKIYHELLRQKKSSLLTKEVLSFLRPEYDYDKYIMQMIRSYQKGLTEKEKMDGVKAAIVRIASQYNVEDKVRIMWENMIATEPIVMSSLRRSRGHLRHTLNVFWLGYRILNDDSFIRDMISRASNHHLFKESLDAGNSDIESLNMPWFLAAVFHDVGKYLEEFPQIMTGHKTHLKQFNFIGSPQITSTWNLNLSPSPFIHLSECFHPDKERKVLDKMSDLWKEETEETTISLNHGFISALTLLHELDKKRIRPLARIAARACGLHTIDYSKGVTVNWDDDPISCLLLICDLIQTWERERVDESYFDVGQSHSAEVVKFQISAGEIELSVNYLPPRYIVKSSELLSKESDRLQQILLEKVKKNIYERIIGDWPFKLTVNYYINSAQFIPPLKFPIS